MPTFAGKKETVEDTTTGWQFRETVITWTEEVHESLGWQECEYCGEDEHYDEAPTTVEITEAEVDSMSESLSNSVTSNASATIGSQIAGTPIAGLTPTISGEITAGKSKSKTSSQSFSRQFQSSIGKKQTFETRKHSKTKGIMRREDYGLCASVTMTITITVTLKPNGDALGWPVVQVDVQNPTLDFCRRKVEDRKIECDTEPVIQSPLEPTPIPFEDQKLMHIYLPKPVFAAINTLAEKSNKPVAAVMLEILEQGSEL